MPLDLDRFVRLRPRLYHLTASLNARRIRATGAIHSASQLLRLSEQQAVVRTRRADGMWIECDGDRVHIRDQAPLYRGNISFEDGWEFEDFIEHLNDHVFFWPGSAHGPIPYGIRHFQRYANDDAVVLALDTRDVFSANPTPGPKFCKYNSGSPRCTGGRGSPRGHNTFANPMAFHHVPSQVIEVTFSGMVSLSGCKIAEHKVANLVG